MLTFVVPSSADYFPQFLVLHESIRRFHPEARIVLRTSGNVHGPIPEDVDAVPLVEYSHAMARERPAMILRELDDDVCFLGADTELFGRIEPPEGDVVLVPHHIRPIAVDGHTPSLGESNIAGFYNSDFQYVRPGGRAAYQWFAEVCEQHCFMSQTWCNEQSWMSHLPCLFPNVTIWRTTQISATYNVMAHSYRNGMTEDGPLVLMHYSGFDIQNPTRLSRYGSRYPNVGSHPIGKLLAGYAERVQAAESRCADHEHGRALTVCEPRHPGRLV